VTTSAQSGPTIIVLTGPDCAEFGLRPPAFIESENDGARYVVKILRPEGIDSFGAGPSIHAAIKDLVEVMRAEAAALRAHHDRLSPDMARELAAIEAILGPTETAMASPSAYLGAPSRIDATGPAFSAPLARSSYLPILSN
jgi:hypothetical protein